MELLSPEILGQLGVSAVLAVFLFLAWKRLQEKDEEVIEGRREAAQERKEMNDHIRAITQDLSAKYEENTRMTERVKYALENNTTTMSKVLDRFDGTMRGSSKD